MANFLLQRYRRVAVAMGLCGAVLVGGLAASAPASADTVPVDPTETATVSTDFLPTTQVDGVVWSQAIVGDTVYAGGSFAKARPAGAAAGVNTTTRTHLLAYSISTGVLKSSFAPTLNGQVRVTAVSPDQKRLYIGGDFTVVNGTARNRVAAFDTATGALLPWNPNANKTVRAILAVGDTVYLGGDFTSLGGSSRARAGAVTASTNALQAWAPSAEAGGVYGIAQSPDGTKVALGGRFTSLNGSTSPGYGLGMVSSASSGNGKTTSTLLANSVVKNAGPNGAILSLISDGDSFYAGGYDFGVGANFEGIVRLRWSDGAIIWMEDCHGDTYTVYPAGGLIYDSSHAHSCSTVPKGFPEVSPRVNRQALAFTKDVKGTLTKPGGTNYQNFAGQPAPALVNWYPDFIIGSYTGQNQATWTVTGNSQYVIFGGEFIAVNGKKQQGLSRFAQKTVAPNADGPRLSGASFTPTTASSAAGKITISWQANFDRDNELLTYKVIRDNNTAAPAGTVVSKSRHHQRPQLSFTDTVASGSTHSYYVLASDPFGNTAKSATVSGKALAGAVATPPPTTTPPPTSPAPGGALAADTFTRSVSGGFGSAETGGAWSTTGSASNFSVDGSSGRMTIPRAGQYIHANLAGGSSTSTDLSVKVSLAEAVQGGSAYVIVKGRVVGAEDYRTRLVIGTGGSVVQQLQRGSSTMTAVTVPGLTYAAGDVLNVRLQVFGTAPTTVRAKVWKAGAAEPSAWIVSKTDATAALQSAGTVGLGFYLGSTSTGVPRTAVFDDLTAVTGP